MTVRIDYKRALSLAKRIGKIKLSKIDVFDEKFFPAKDSSEEDVARYLLVMVAMDHRLSRPAAPYEAVIDGEYYEGADLLYRLGKKLFEENRRWFSPEKLTTITRDDVLRWLSPNDRVRPPDPELRALLLRDLGRKLLKVYSGRASSIYKESCGKIVDRIRGCGLLDRLKVFQAYNDPVEKKPHLLTKFLIARGLFNPQDRENERVPVDNRLVRIALRTGIVQLSGSLKTKLLSGICFSEDEDILLRIVVREAWHLVAVHSGIEDYSLDDHLWIFGGKCCGREKPVCVTGCDEQCGEVGGCDAGCLFSIVCRYCCRRHMPEEHCFYNTYYY